MLERIISYMDSVQRPVSTYDIAMGTGFSEVKVVGKLNYMQKKGMVRNLYTNIQTSSRIHYELTLHRCKVKYGKTEKKSKET